MGVYSELDIDRQYGDVPPDDPFVEDNPFEEDDISAPVAAHQTAGTVTVAAPAQSAIQSESEPAKAAAKADDGKEDEDAERRAHEEAEDQRETEWKAKQQQKKDAEALQLVKLDAMSDAEVLAASLKRVSDDTEKLTRRNMMECVMEHIQTLCLSTPI